MGAMLTEEALILLATLGAAGMLVLGVLELLWPSRPTPSAARRARTTPSEDDEPDASPLTWRLLGERAVVVSDVEPPARTFRPEEIWVSPPATDASSEVAVGESVVAEPVVASPADASDATQFAPTAQAPSIANEFPQERFVSPIPERAALHDEVRGPVLPIETCVAMYEAQRFTEVVSLGSAALELHAGMASVSNRFEEAAALQDLVALSKHELGDREGARAAFIAAIRGAAPDVRATYVDHLVAAVRAVADPEADAGKGDTDRLRELRACMIALDDVLAVVPGNEDVHATQGMVRDALSPVCERLVARVASGHEGEEVRLLVVDTLTDETMPLAWRERVRAQLTAVSSAEIGQLTAQAIRRLQEGHDADALDALARAERLSAALPHDAVTEERREEFERRLWWGYTKVGVRRLDTASFEEALEPLFAALRLAGPDEERGVETRGALARALGGAVEDGVRRVQKLAVNDPATAHIEFARLTQLLRTATERGVSREELADAFDDLARAEENLPEPRA